MWIRCQWTLAKKHFDKMITIFGNWKWYIQTIVFFPLNLINCPNYDFFSRFWMSYILNANKRFVPQFQHECDHWYSFQNSMKPIFVIFQPSKNCSTLLLVRRHFDPPRRFFFCLISLKKMDWICSQSAEIETNLEQPHTQLFKSVLN